MTRAGNTPETLHRHWLLLRLIPRGPKKIDSATLETRLADEGIAVTRRSLQRDLESLSESFPGLSCDKRSKPFGWYWAPNAPSLDVPPMSLQTAVTLEMVHAYLLHALPRTAVHSLEPLFQRGRDAIAKEPLTRLARWPRKVRVIPRGLSLKTPDVPEAILDPVYEGLLQERQLRVKYRPRNASEPHEMDISPLALVLRHEVLLLVSRVGKKLYHLLLHRIESASVLDSKSVAPQGFDIDEYLSTGVLGYSLGDTFTLEARVAPIVAQTLRESPLSTDQHMEAESTAETSWYRVRATIANNLETRGWISSYGPLIEVLGPPELRQEYVDMAKQLACTYAT